MNHILLQSSLKYFFSVIPCWDTYKGCPEKDASINASIFLYYLAGHFLDNSHILPIGTTLHESFRAASAFSSQKFYLPEKNDSNFH